MDKVKIVYVIGGLSRGGTEKQLYLLLRHLDRRVFSPTVVSLSAGGAWAPSIRDLGVPVIELVRRYSFELSRLIQLWTIVRRVAPDILQTCLRFDTVYGFVTGRLAGVPILIGSRRTDQYSKFQGVQRLNRLLWRWADAIICNSERSRTCSVRAVAERHVVIRNGIEWPGTNQSRAEARRSLGLPPETMTVGTVGRLVEAKNHPLFLELAQEICRTRTDIRFVLVGGGPLEQRLRVQVREHGLEGKIVMTGERADVPDLMAAFDIFVITSNRDGMSNALMEAMASGLPCVATDAGGNGEVLVHGDTGYLCPREDRKSLVEAVCRLLDDPVRRRQFGRNGRTRIESEFSAERMARETEALYHRLVSRALRSPSEVSLAIPQGSPRS